MAYRVPVSVEDEKTYVSLKLGEFISFWAALYTIFPVSNTLFHIKKHDCVVGTATIEADRSVVFLPSRTELGEEFRKELFRADPTIWWKVIYHAEGKWEFAGKDLGRATKIEALKEMTKEQFLAGARLVSFRNGGAEYGVLKTISSFLIRGEWPKCYVDNKDWGDVPYIIER